MQRENTYRFSPPKPIENYSKDSIKKIAVLFTDIVGSSKFFKERGDIAGRKMLKTHQDIASPTITGFGGTVVKMIGDSVLAYFYDPSDALNSAIKIQQKFRTFNETHRSKDHIRVRICIHYGDGILDEGDIFGDVVNMAAKFLTYTNGDQIMISQELRSNLEDMQLIHFNRFEYTDPKKILNGIELFNVEWDQKLAIDPTLTTLMIIKPVWALAKKDFHGIWAGMIQESQLFPENMVEKIQIGQDRAVNIIVRETPMAIPLAEKILDFLRINMGHDGLSYVPVQILIDTGGYIISDRISLAGLRVTWKDLEPGEIHISKKASNYLRAGGGTETGGMIRAGKDGEYLKITTNDLQNRKSRQAFKYQNALVQGENQPCFYCGSRAHNLFDCPSKDITEFTHAIEKMGYMNISEINSHFFNFLHETSSQEVTAGSPAAESESENIACFAFYELKCVFQLRLLRALWSLNEEKWNMVFESRDDSEKGGLLWIAFDCIRVSNFDQAESIIHNELLKKNDDFRLLILAALLLIEKNQFSKACDYLKKALDRAKSTPQKIYILFLLSRVFYLSEDIVKARESLRRILRLSPYCTEAMYQEIVFKFHHGDKSAALDQLVKLIKKNRDYYVISLIDPDLAAYSVKIQARLDKLLSDAREQAGITIPLVREEIASLEKIMGNDVKEITEAHSVLSRIDELLISDSYSGYLDIIHYSENINRLGHRITEGREVSLNKKQRNIKQGIAKCRNYLKLIPYDFLTTSVRQQLKIVEAKFEATCEKIKLEGIEDFKIFMKDFNTYSSELEMIESRMKRIDTTAQLLKFTSKFFKNTVIFQSINLILSLILLPILIHYMNFIVPGLNLSTEGIWHYQKILITLGGIFGLILATVVSQKSTTG